MTGPLYDHLRGRHDWDGRASVDTLQAVKYLQALGHERPALLAYWPTARVNPFQALLYAALWEHGVAPVPCLTLDDVDEVREVAARTGSRVALHLHWLGGMIADAGTEEEAEAAVGRELARLDAWRDAGGTLVWSVHNVLPHDSRFEKWDAALRQGVADRADLVHVLAAGTADDVAEWFTLPTERTVHIGHPSYVGAYPDVVRRDEARWSLGLQPDDRVYALLGAIKPYKGLDHLLTAFDEVAAADPMRYALVVAGAADDHPDTAAFLERCEMHPRVLLRASRVPDAEMQYYLHAADLAVMPYQRSLNSGVLMLALSFGLPVVAPDVAGVRETVDPSAARLFPPGDVAALVAALREAEALCTPQARAAAAALAARHDPRDVAERFARALVDHALPPR